MKCIRWIYNILLQLDNKCQLLHVNLSKNSLIATIKKKKYLCLIILIALQCLVMVYWGNQKKGYVTDEFFSFEGANYGGRGMVYWSNDDGFWGEWHTNEEFIERLTVDEGESLWNPENWTDENSEYPLSLYYIMLNLANSFAGGEYTKWPSIIMNIMIFCLTQLVLFKTVKRIEDDNAALLAVCIYGFSAAAVSSVIYIRFYMLISLFVILTNNILVKLLYSKRIWQKMICLCCFAGIALLFYSEQPIALLYMALLFLSAFLYLFIQNRKKEVLGYLSIIVLGLLCIGIFLPSIYAHVHILFQTLNVYQNATYFDLYDIIKKLVQCSEQIYRMLFYNIYGIGFFIALFVLLFVIDQTCIKCDKEKSEQKRLILLFVYPLIITLIILSRLINFDTLVPWRYISICYTPCIMTFVLIMIHLAKKTNLRYLVTDLILTAFLVISVLSYQLPRVQELYQEMDETKSYITENYAGWDGVYFDYGISMNWLYDAGYLWNEDTKVYTDKITNLLDASYQIDDFEQEHLLLWLNCDYDIGDAVRAFLSKTQYDKAEEVASYHAIRVFECSK